MSTDSTADATSSAEGTNPAEATKDAVLRAQAEAITSIKAYQQATVKTVEAWTEAQNKVTPEGMAVEVPEEIKASMLDPVMLVDLNYDFAREVLDLNRTFALQVLNVSKPVKRARPAPEPDIV